MFSIIDQATFAYHNFTRLFPELTLRLSPLRFTGSITDIPFSCGSLLARDSPLVGELGEVILFPVIIIEFTPVTITCVYCSTWGYLAHNLIRNRVLEPLINYPTLHNVLESSVCPIINKSRLNFTWHAYSVLYSKDPQIITTWKLLLDCLWMKRASSSGPSRPVIATTSSTCACGACVFRVVRFSCFGLAVGSWQRRRSLLNSPLWHIGARFV